MSDKIKKWFYDTTCSQFRRDSEAYYNFGLPFFVDFIKRSGTEFILNKDLSSRIKYQGQRPNPNMGTVLHFIPVEIWQEETLVYQEVHVLEDL